MKCTYCDGTDTLEHNNIFVYMVSPTLKTHKGFFSKKKEQRDKEEDRFVDLSVVRCESIIRRQ